MEQQAVWRSPNPEASLQPPPNIGVNTVTSITPIDPTDPGPFTFELNLDNVQNPFLPIGGTVFIENSEDQAKWIFGIIRAYDTSVDPTVLTLEKILTSVTASETIESWLIDIVDGPPTPLPYYGISGLTISRDAGDLLHDIFIGEGSVMSSDGTTVLTLLDPIVKKLDALFLEGTNQGAAILSAALTGTVSSVGTSVTGVGSLFMTELNGDLASKLNDYDNTYANIPYVLANQIVPTVASLTANGVTRAIDFVVSNTSLQTWNNLGAGAGSTYFRGGPLILAGYQYFGIVIMRRDSDGLVDIGATNFTPSGEPDLPAGYTQARVIGVVECQDNMIIRIDQPLYAVSAPNSKQIVFPQGTLTPAFAGDTLDEVANVLNARTQPANTTTEGIIRIATNAEADAGAVNNAAVAPTGLDTRLTSSKGINTGGGLLSTHPTDGVGYHVGAGGSVNQTTNKSTAVTINRCNGIITMNAAALAANTEVQFTVNNSMFDSNDNVIVSHRNVGTLGAYLVQVCDFSAGAFKISVRNMTAGSLSQGIVIKFTVIKGENT